jgi:hypothetical protein
MLIADLPFPITIVAPDGWAEFLKTVDDARSWNSVAIRKYNQIGFLVADASGSVWVLDKLTTLEKPSLLDRIRFQPRRLLTDVALRSVDGLPLDVFRDRLRVALSADSDVMTQFCSHEKIVTAIDRATSVAGLTATLHKMRVI